MKKDLHGGVIIGILAVVVVVVVVMAWRVLGPPGPVGIKPFDKASLKVMQEEHAKSAAEVRQEQMRLYQQSHAGGR